MPLILNKDMPVYGMLRAQHPETIAQEGSYRETDVLHVVLLNLMSDKIATELQYLRCLGTSPKYIHVEFMRQTTYRSMRQDEGYLQRFYLTLSDVMPRRFDGMVITGAPLEHISCEDTLYWEEFCQILKWSRTNVRSIFAGCWGAFAGVHRDHGVAKTNLSRKLSGIYELDCFCPDEPLFRGCVQPLPIPLSRATDMALEDVKAAPELVLLASARNGSPVFLKSTDNQYIYCTGHPEYEQTRLAMEYRRDSGLEKAWITQVPVNYFPQDDPNQMPVDTWTETGSQLFRNWIEFYVCK